LREVVGLGALREDIAALAGENPSALGLQDPSGGDHVDRAPGDADLEARDALRRPRRLVAREFDPRGDVLDDLVAWGGPSITEHLENSSLEQSMAHPGPTLRSRSDGGHAVLDDAFELLGVLGHPEEGHHRAHLIERALRVCGAGHIGHEPLDRPAVPMLGHPRVMLERTGDAHDVEARRLLAGGDDEVTFAHLERESAEDPCPDWERPGLR